MIKEAISKVVIGQNLTQEETASVIEEIMSGNATDSQIASFITALRMKGETIDEITGAARVMRMHAVKIRIRSDGCKLIDWKTIVDTCGTGGDHAKTFNVSTAAAFVVAGIGVVVAKHGNRAVSSKCGSADVLEAMGINVDLAVEKVEECINQIGLGFLFAPNIHLAMKFAINPRREIGIRTIFNMLGPLTNPAGANAQVLGVYLAKLTEPVAYVLKNLGTKRAFVVHGMDSVDEISVSAETQVSELKDGVVRTYMIAPEDFGIKRAKKDDVSGGGAGENAATILKILNGEGGPKRDIVVINAAAAIAAAGKSKDILEGVKVAEESIDSGKAAEKLEQLRRICGK